jgi:hypothetical protein
MGPTNYKGVAGGNWGWGDARWNPVPVPTGNTNGLDAGDGIFYRTDYLNKLRLTGIMDGTSNTFMIGETMPTKDYHTDWAFFNHATGTCAIYPNAKTAAGAEFGLTDWPNVYSFRSNHTGGLQFAMGDASVRFVSDSVPLFNYRAMCSIQGGEVANTDF